MKSDTLRNAILDLVVGGQAYTPASTLYVALLTALPSDPSSAPTEVSGTGYARVAVANNLTNWPAAVQGGKSNALAISYGTAGGSWGTVVAVALYSTPTGGTYLVAGQLTAPVTVASGNVVTIEAGALTILEA